MRYIKRLLYIPLGMIEGVLAFINNNARDVENRKRYPLSIIDKGSSFTPDTLIGKGSHILENVTFNCCKIGQYTYISRNALIQHAVIGNYCSIAHNVNIGLGKHPLHLPSSSPVFYRRNNSVGIKVVSVDLEFEEYGVVNIGHDVWIGAGAVIMDGVSVSTGAVVAAGAVVTKNIPPYAIVAGVPAKIIRYRFEEEKREELLNSEWWMLAPREAYKLMEDL